MSQGDGFRTRPPPSPWRWGLSTATAAAAHGLLLILPGLSDPAPAPAPAPERAVPFTLVALPPPPAPPPAAPHAPATPEELEPAAPPKALEAPPDAVAPPRPAPRPRRFVELSEGPEAPDPARAEHFAARAQRAEDDTRAVDELPAARQDEANTPGITASTGAQAQRVNTAREEPVTRRGEDIADAGDGDDRRSPQAATGAPEEREGQAAPQTADAPELVTPREDTPHDPDQNDADAEGEEALAQLLPAEPPRPPSASTARPALDAPPPAPLGARPPEVRPRAPAPPPAPPPVASAAPPPARPEAAPRADRLAPARPGQTDGEGDGEGGRSARPDEPVITLPGAPQLAGAGSPTSPAARLDLELGEVSQVATVADPLAAWLGDVHKVARRGFSEAVPVQLKLDGVEGEAEVNFCVSRRGKVWEPRLVESSGVDGLDAAALSALPARVPRPPEEAELHGLGACYPHAIRFVQVNDRR